MITIDTNLGLEFARRFGRDGYKSYYNIMTFNPYPKLEEVISGYGFEEIIKIEDWAELVEKQEAIVFTDVGFGYWADFLRSRGFNVFGADRKTQKLELDRFHMKKTLDEHNIKTSQWLYGIGLDIPEFNSKKFIKLSKIRGSLETFGTDDPNEMKFQLRQAFGPVVNDVEWILEDELSGVEIGVDTFFNGKNFLDKIAETLEVKGAGNITRFNDYNDSIWYETLEKFRPILEENGFRGMFCLEGFYDDNEIAITDITARFPYPCGYAYPFVLDNFSEVVIGAAAGEDVPVLNSSEYSVQFGVYTDDTSTWREIKTKDNNKTAFRRAAIIDDRIWYVPGDSLIATAIGRGDTLSDAINDARSVVNGITAINSYNLSDLIINEGAKKFKEVYE